jgi:hypothetical protein
MPACAGMTSFPRKRESCFCLSCPGRAWARILRQSLAVTAVPGRAWDGANFVSEQQSEESLRETLRCTQGDKARVRILYGLIEPFSAQFFASCGYPLLFFLTYLARCIFPCYHVTQPCRSRCRERAANSQIAKLMGRGGKRGHATMSLLRDTGEREVGRATSADVSKAPWESHLPTLRYSDQ